MVTGTTPFVFPADTDPQIMLSAHLTEEIEPPTERMPDLDLPEWIDDIILDALLRDPERRYRNSSAFADAFRGALEAETPPDSTVPLNHLPRFDPRNNPTVVFSEQPIIGAKRSRPPRVASMQTGWIWKLFLIMILANLLLAGLLLATRGKIPGLYEPRDSSFNRCKRRNHNGFPQHPRRPRCQFRRSGATGTGRRCERHWPAHQWLAPDRGRTGWPEDQRVCLDRIHQDPADERVR